MMDIKAVMGFKVTTEITKAKGAATIESLVLFSEHESKAEPENNIWVEIHIGFKGAAFKSSVISFSYSGDLKDSKAIQNLAVELTNEYAPGMVEELIDLLPEPEEITESNIIELKIPGGGE